MVLTGCAQSSVPSKSTLIEEVATPEPIVVESDIQTDYNRTPITELSLQTYISEDLRSPGTLKNSYNINAIEADDKYRFSISVYIAMVDQLGEDHLYVDDPKPAEGNYRVKAYWDSRDEKNVEDFKSLLSLGDVITMLCIADGREDIHTIVLVGCTSLNVLDN